MSETIGNSRENPEYEKWSILEEDQEEVAPVGEEEAPEALPSPEQKERELTFEHLSGISTEEYLELWRHLNPFYTTHVTRQGIRDHSGMMYHTAGVGAFQNGGKEVFADGKILRTPAEARYGLPADFTEEDVAKALEEMVPQDDEFEGWTPQQILQNLPFNSTMASADPWADKQAIHFAQHTVLDELYGGERNNEVFFVFPTDVLASQCKFGGHMHGDLTTAQVSSERKWNDLFVWPEDGKIPLDAGFAFLPKSQMVDRKTGSKYATREVVDEEGNTELVPEKDEERIVRFREWVGNLSENSPEVVAISQNNDYSLMEEKLRSIGIPEECIGGMIYYGNHCGLLNGAKVGHFYNLYDLSEEQQEQMSRDEILDYSVRAYLSSHNADLKLAEDTVPAEEYWEQYFAENPEQRPAHIVYYDGDPSKAVREFLIQNGILREKPDYGYYGQSSDDHTQTITGPGDVSGRDGGMLGFDAHYIGDGTEDEHLSAEHERFNELALKILREKFGKKDTPERGTDSGSEDFDFFDYY